MAKSEFKYVIYIRTNPEKLWRALTTPASIQKYWFGMSVDCQWKAGSSWRLTAENGELMDSGKILKCTPRKQVVIQWRNEWKRQLHAEGNARCVYELQKEGACVKLTITHSMNRPNSKFIKAVSEGWPMILSNLKSLLETSKVALKA